MINKKSNKNWKSVIVVPIEKLEVCPHNPRKTDLDLDDLEEVC